MIGTRALARTLLASIFVAGGANTLRKSSEVAPQVKQVTDPIADAVGLDASTEKLVQVNAGVQIAGGALLALGIASRPAALALGVTLVPTTLASHRFWESSDDEEKQQSLIHFLKNASILGGLIFAALDTGGRPSVFWSGKMAAVGAADAVTNTAHKAYDTVAP